MSPPCSHTLILDNGPQYTATATVLYAHELGLVPITTPAYSPESNGLAEAFVGTFKRDYLGDAELRDAEGVLAQLAGWIDDYASQAPHSALGMRSPRKYRAELRTTPEAVPRASSATSHWPQDARSTGGVAIWVSPEIGRGVSPCEQLTFSSPPVQKNGEHSIPIAASSRRAVRAPARIPATPSMP